MSVPDPFTEIREALNRAASWHLSLAVVDSALATLARLEREAAERETALAEAYAHGYDRASSLAMEHAGEVEAERDRLNAEFDRIDGKTVESLNVANADLRATVARQAETLGDLIEYAARRDREKHSYAESATYVEAAPIQLARAVLASPEAAAAEPPCDPRTCTNDTCEKYGCVQKLNESAAALPAVDAAPELRKCRYCKHLDEQHYPAEKGKAEGELRLCCGYDRGVSCPCPGFAPVDAPPEPTT